MKRLMPLAPAMPVLLLLALVALSSRTHGQTASTLPPSWLTEEMTLLAAGEGRWRADNTPHKSPTEPFEAYGLRWEWGPGRSSVRGRLFGYRDGREMPPLFEYRLYWDPLASEARLLQWGRGGAYGEGTMTRTDTGEIRIDQVLWDGARKTSVRHIEVMNDGERHSRDFKQAGDQWIPNRTYVWQSVAPVQSNGATRLRLVTGLGVPESARYDEARDAWLVSNVTGPPTRADNTGFISILDADGRIRERSFIAGGRGGVTLHAPKGMILKGSELWVADIDTIRRFERTTGRPLGEISLKTLGAKFLNDLATGPDGSVYASDTGFSFDASGRGSLPGPHRVFRVDQTLRPTVLIDDPKIEGPNGLFYDEATKRLLIASFMGKSLFSWTPAAGLEIVAEGPGGYDGIERLPDGRIVVSSQDGRALLVLDGDRLTPLLAGIEDAGDIGVDPKRNRIAVPRLDTNLLEIWQLR